MSALADTQERADGAAPAAQDAGAEAACSTSSAGYQASASASTNVAELLSKDNEDESLRRYKEQLLGAAASGDLGNTSDPRMVVIEEFRIIFEAPDVHDMAFNLSTDEGVAMLKSAGIKMKEGSKYKFRFSFRVQHEIADALTYHVSLTKLGFGESDQIVLGSYPPQSELHMFEYPRRGWEEAPKGMLFRGKATAKCKFVDGKGTIHMDFSYPVNITK